jgi:4-amino-4-deoxy-L-arabinose transferase-like glycosyltransferase
MVCCAVAFPRRWRLHRSVMVLHDAQPQQRVPKWLDAARGDRAVLATVVVALVTVIGLAIRLVIADSALVGDEVSTYWVVTTHTAHGVISTVHGDAEITPPLNFLAAWVTTQLGHAPLLVRAPSLIAGTASIPLVYLLGLRTVGRPAAVVASVLTALSPFMIVFSAEARGYGLMMFLVVGSTLAMLLAIDDHRSRWWILYAVCSCAAAYTHYTSVFPLAAQLVWLTWYHPEARKPALFANLAALAAFLPWTTGLVNDLHPASEIFSVFGAHDAHAFLGNVGKWSTGAYYGGVSLRDLPGPPALVLRALAVIIAAAAVATAWVFHRPRRRRGRGDHRLVLVLALLVSAPVCEVILALFGPNLLLTRNLAPSWPALALCCAALLTAAGPRLRMVTVLLAVASFVIGAGRMLEVQYQRPDYEGAADLVVDRAAPGDVVIDATKPFSSGPVSPLDVTLHGRGSVRVLRVGSRPPFVPMADAIDQAVASVRHGRIFVVGTTYFRVDRSLGRRLERPGAVPSALPARFHAQTRAFPGRFGVLVSIYADVRDGHAARGPTTRSRAP